MVTRSKTNSPVTSHCNTPDLAKDGALSRRGGQAEPGLQTCHLCESQGPSSDQQWSDSIAHVLGGLVCPLYLQPT